MAEVLLGSGGDSETAELAQEIDQMETEIESLQGYVQTLEQRIGVLETQRNLPAGSAGRGHVFPAGEIRGAPLTRVIGTIAHQRLTSRLARWGLLHVTRYLLDAAEISTIIAPVVVSLVMIAVYAFIQAEVQRQIAWERVYRQTIERAERQAELRALYRGIVPE